MFVEKAEIKPGEGERLDVAERGKFARSQPIWHDPLQLVRLSEVQIANVTAARPQACLKPQFEVWEGVQLDGGEEMAATPMDPTGRDEGTGEKALGVTTEDVDYLLDEF